MIDECAIGCSVQCTKEKTFTIQVQTASSYALSVANCAISDVLMDMDFVLDIFWKTLMHHSKDVHMLQNQVIRCAHRLYQNMKKEGKHFQI